MERSAREPGERSKGARRKKRRRRKGAWRDQEERWEGSWMGAGKEHEGSRGEWLRSVRSRRFEYRGRRGSRDVTRREHGGRARSWSMDGV